MVEMIKLDKTDRKILYYLDLNARYASSTIAKKLKTSREVVDYRIKRLVREGVIARFFTHIQAQKLGYTLYKIYLKVKGLAEQQERELVDYLVKHGHVYRIMRCHGNYDFIVSLISKDVYMLHRMLDEFFHKYDENFISKDVTISTNLFRNRMDYIAGREMHDLQPLFYGGEKGNIELDDKDIELLKIVANNARMPLVSISKKIGLTSGAVMYRMKELEKKQIISAYRCALNLERIGYSSYRIFLSLHFTNPKKEKELEQFCRQHPNITLYLRCIGHWDFEIEFEIESASYFHALFNELKTRFSEIIKECEYVHIMKEHKFDHFPGCYPVNLSS